MPSHKLIHASPPQSQNVLYTYLCGTQMESWIRLWMYPCVKTMEFWNRLWMYQCVKSRIIWWNCQTGSEHTHLLHRRNSGSGPECTCVFLQQALNICMCHRDGILEQPLNIPKCHRAGILEQALNVPMCHIWNSGRGSEHTHVTDGILEEAVNVLCQRQNFWTRLWIYSCITETEFWTRLRMYPCVIDGTVG